jgi:hypothetical protein
MLKKKKAVKEEPKKEHAQYFVFAHYGDSHDWWFCGEHDTKEDAERNGMEVTGEPEDVHYKVIKGIELGTKEGIAVYPTMIDE